MSEHRWAAYEPSDLGVETFCTREAAVKWLIEQNCSDEIPEGYAEGEAWIAEIKARTATVPTGEKTG